MSRKHTQPTRDVEPPEIDELKLIHGIGPAVESRLHGVGVYSFAQLAALSPADIMASLSGLAGLTADRIIKQDWIGQARELAGQSNQAEQDADPLPAPREFDEPAAAPRIFGGILRLSNLELLQTGSEGHHTILASNKPFAVSLTLDMREAVFPSEDALTYTASIFGKNLQKDARLILGKSTGPVSPAEHKTVTVQGQAREQGVYHMEVMVTVAQRAAEQNLSHGLTAQVDGGLRLFN